MTGSHALVSHFGGWKKLTKLWQWVNSPNGCKVTLYALAYFHRCPRPNGRRALLSDRAPCRGTLTTAYNSQDRLSRVRRHMIALAHFPETSDIPKDDAGRRLK